VGIYIPSVRHFPKQISEKNVARGDPRVVTVMKDPKSWQAAWFNADKKLELDFWLKSGANTNASAKPATSGHKGRKTVSAGRPH